MVFAPSYEIIDFDFWFESSYWRNPPIIDIFVDDNKIDTVIVDQEIHYHFSRRLDFGNHSVKIKRYGKTADETRVNDCGEYDTQTLTIRQVNIDNINLRNILWDRAKFFPVYPEPWATQQILLGHLLETQVLGEMTLGHNGTWVFDFSSPFYQFIVDCVRTPR